MNLIEPTYLRYVHDNLEKESLNAENAAALPFGFIGLYEEDFQSNIPISKRQSTLKSLAIWALFKGGVSSYLASQILNESQEDTKSLIDSFSSWFNTTESNKYILYHDRLRTYLLQKLSSHELQELNEQIISYLEKALEAQKGDEAEIYALEHLSTHMAVESQMDSNYQRLHNFANKETLWPRQVSISKEYKWSQQAVQYSIKEGARRHHEMNTLSSTVNSVKLTQEEKSSIHQILDFLIKGDYQTALFRSQSFENDKKLKILLLMIYDLTNGSSSTISSKKKACNEIIIEISNTNAEIREFPIIAIYLSHIELIKIGLDDSIIWKKVYKETNNQTKSILIELLEFKELDFKIHNLLINNLLIEIDKIDLFVLRSSKLFENNHNELAILELSKALSILSKLDMSNYPHKYMNMTVEDTNEKFYLSFMDDMYNWYYNISDVYSKNGYLKESMQYLNIAKNYINNITQESVDNSNKSQKELGFYGDDKIWELSIYQYLKHGDISKIYIACNEFNQLASLMRYKSSAEFLSYLEEDYKINTDSVSGIKSIYEEEINGIKDVLSHNREDVFHEMYKSLNIDGDNYKYIKVLFLLEKLKYHFNQNINFDLSSQIEEIITLINSFSNNTYKLSIYYESFITLFDCEIYEKGQLVLEELYDNITNVWGNEKNIERFADVVATFLVKIYEGLYLHIEKNRAENILNDAIRINSSLTNLKRKKGINEEIISTLIKTRNNSFLNSFLDSLISDGIQITSDYQLVRHSENIQIDILKKHVHLLFSENKYEEAISFLQKHNINPISDKSINFKIYPINWNRYHLLEEESKELHVFFRTEDLIKIYSSNDKWLNLSLCIQNRLSSDPKKFSAFILDQINSIEKISTYSDYNNEWSRKNVIQTIGKTNYKSRNEQIFKKICEKKSLDKSLEILEYFEFEKETNFFGINTKNNYETSDILRNVLINTYTSKILQFYSKNNFDAINRIANNLLIFLENNDLGKGTSGYNSLYDYNTLENLKLSIFFMNLDIKEYSLKCIEKCVKVENLMKLSNPDHIKIYEAYFKIYKKYSTKNAYINILMNVFNNNLNTYNEIVEYDLIENSLLINILYLLDEIKENKQVLNCSRKIMEINKEAKFKYEEDRENTLSKVAEFYFKTGRFDLGDKLYNGLSEDFKKSITSRTLNLEYVKSEYLIKNDKLDTLKENYTHKNIFINRTFTLENSLWDRNTSVYVSGLLDICKLLNKYKYIKTLKNTLIDAKEICDEFFKFQSKNPKNENSDIEYEKFNIIKYLIEIFEYFHEQEEEKHAKETLEKLINNYEGNLDLLKSLKDTNVKLQAILKMLNEINIENKPFKDQFELFIKKLQKEKIELDNIKDIKTIFRSKFMIDDEYFQTLSCKNNYNFKNFAELLIQYIKVKTFFSKKEEELLSNLEDVVDYSEWIEISKKIKAA